MNVQPKLTRTLNATRRGRRNLALVVTLALLTLSVSLSSWHAQARTAPSAAPLFATLTVNSLDDSGPGTLRQAIADAQPGDTIDFSVTGEILLISGHLVINKHLTIQGPGQTLLTINGNQASRIFHIVGGVNATINDLTITNGKVTNLSPPYNIPVGGGILNEGSLQLTRCAVTQNVALGEYLVSVGGVMNLHGTLSIAHCTITGNTADGSDVSDSTYVEGGGIWSYGPTTMINSTITDNLARGEGGGFGYVVGGGIYVREGNHFVTNCLIARNRIAAARILAEGGGIFTGGGTLTLTNSTLSGNQIENTGGSARGGGLRTTDSLSGAPPRITNCTLTSNSVSSNSSASGGGIFTEGGHTPYVKNSIVAGNTVSPSGAGPDVIGSYVTQGYNLIGKNDNSTGFVNGANQDQVGTIAAPLDPQLAPLANNGGLTQTHALLATSPAIEAGDNCVLTNTCASPNAGLSLTTDQRGAGFPRIIGASVDIGAVEYNATPTLTAYGVTIAQSSAVNNVSLGIAGDLDQAPETLSVSATLSIGSGVTLSGISVSSAGNVTANVEATCGATNSTFTLRVTDSGSLSAESLLTVNVTPETTPPTINPISPVVVSLPLNSPTTSMVVNFPLPTATDNCTANPTVTTTPASGSVFPVGTTTVNVTALDGAGNQSTASFTVTVNAGYHFTGFFSPVDNLPVVNTVNAGQAIPVKFSLGSNRGLNIFAAGFPASQRVACSSGAPVSPIEETVNAGASSLSYDAAADRYNYVWKTDRAWKGQCRKLILTFNDGTTREALFQFK